MDTNAPDPLFDDAPAAPAETAAPSSAPDAPDAEALGRELSPAERVVAARQELDRAQRDLRAAGPPPEPRKPSLVETRAQVQANLARVARRRAEARRAAAALGVRKRKPYPPLFASKAPKDGGE